MAKFLHVTRQSLAPAYFLLFSFFLKKKKQRGSEMID
jgi:hypothetical protein